ncbi:hypothetical protein ACHAWF_013422 [Thalassiosira exigua]
MYVLTSAPPPRRALLLPSTMKSNICRPTAAAAVAACFRLALSAAPAVAQTPESTPGSTTTDPDPDGCSPGPSYDRLPPGRTAWLDDGGCYFCSKFPGSSFPLSDEESLSSHCERMCDADPECRSYSVARPAVLHVHEWYWGKSANCCLERTHYPELLVDASAVEEGQVPDPCQLEIMCWTRYEKKEGGGEGCDEEAVAEEVVPSDQCKRVWKAKSYSEERIRKEVKFMAGGCDYKADEFESMLADAYSECKAEVAQESGESEGETQHLLEGIVGHYANMHRSAWVAHGSVGALTFGLLVPLDVSFALFRDRIPPDWVCAHVLVNGLTSALTFVAVATAVWTMNGMGRAGEGHLKEVHHAAGLVLLFLVSLQAGSRFLRPSRFDAKDVDDEDDGYDAVRRGRRCTSARSAADLSKTAFRLGVFVLGVYQVKSGFGLLAKRYKTPDWGGVYLGYIGWLAALILCGRLWMQWSGRPYERVAVEVQMHSGRTRDPI